MADTVYNKVVVAGETLIDLDSDTLSSASQVLEGYTCHLNSGVSATGSYSVESSKTVAGSMAQQTITPTTGKSAMEQVIVSAVSRTEAADVHGTSVTFG